MTDSIYKTPAEFDRAIKKAANKAMQRYHGMPHLASRRADAPKQAFPGRARAMPPTRPPL